MFEENNTASPKLLKLLAKDVNASERFVRHCLSVFAASALLKTLYGSSLQFRTRSDYASNTLFPQPLPDGYAFSENPKAEERIHYFIECFDGTMPESVMRATITKHIEFYDNGNWEPSTPYPIIVLICRDERLKTKVAKWVQKTVAEGWSDDLCFELLLVTP